MRKVWSDAGRWPRIETITCHATTSSWRNEAHDITALKWNTDKSLFNHDERHSSTRIFSRIKLIEGHAAKPRQSRIPSQGILGESQPLAAGPTDRVRLTRAAAQDHSHPIAHDDVLLYYYRHPEHRLSGEHFVTVKVDFEEIYPQHCARKLDTTRIMSTANKYTDIVVTIADGVGTIKVSSRNTRVP
jgi:hypothetical protein